MQLRAEKGREGGAIGGLPICGVRFAAEADGAPAGELRIATPRVSLGNGRDGAGLPWRPEKSVKRQIRGYHENLQLLRSDLRESVVWPALRADWIFCVHGGFGGEKKGLDSMHKKATSELMWEHVFFAY